MISHLSAKSLNYLFHSPKLYTLLLRQSADLEDSLRRAYSAEVAASATKAGHSHDKSWVFRRRGI